MVSPSFTPSLTAFCIPFSLVIVIHFMSLPLHLVTSLLTGQVVHTETYPSFCHIISTLLDGVLAHCRSPPPQRHFPNSVMVPIYTPRFYHIKMTRIISTLVDVVLAHCRYLPPSFSGSALVPIYTPGWGKAQHNTMLLPGSSMGWHGKLQLKGVRFNDWLKLTALNSFSFFKKKN